MRKKYINQIVNRIIDKLNDYNVKQKLLTLYIFCVLIPLVITDSVILAVVIKADRSSQQHELENIAAAVEYSLISKLDSAGTITKNIYMNRIIDEFMNKEYDTPLAYYDGYLKQMKDSLFKSSIGTSSSIITMYSDNPTIINGGEFSRLEKVQEMEWYSYFKESNQDIICYIYYDDAFEPAVSAKRKISIIRKMNYYKNSNYEKILKLDMDYSSIARDLLNMNYAAKVYVCKDDKIVFSNDGYSSAGADFAEFQKWNKVGYQQAFSFYNNELDIYVLRKGLDIREQIIGNLPLILFLICINALLPWILVKLLSRSFTERLQDLSRAFEAVENESLTEIERANGEDEIGCLMRDYNRMAEKMNELIQTVYKEEMKKQEIDIARQNAELLALHSQINPHFLFNALESIRMHSVLKNERETADMVGKLAKMERQYVEWGTDDEKIREEMEFVEAYLQLQKYRFGNRLSYSIEVEDRCLQYRIPKLTLLTFVENACVHGMENKASVVWIFVRVYIKGKALYLEIEDTGNGICEPVLSELKDRMANANIKDLRQKGRVGIINACLRLKMVSKDNVRFEIDSEEGIGTIVTVQIPLEYVDGGKV